MTSTVPDPISNNTERVLVRNTATGFEQGIAAAAGFFTCGPIGALASWGAIKGLQGKWTPWFVAGIPASIGINVINFGVGALSFVAWNHFTTPNVTEPVLTETAPIESVIEQQEVVQAPQEVVQAPQEVVQPQTTIVPSVTYPSTSYGNEKKANCWFSTPTSGSNLDPFECSISSRINVNNHKVHDIEIDGTKMSLVLWNDGTVEYFNEGIRSTGTWVTDSSNDVVVEVNGTQFAFTPAN